MVGIESGLKVLAIGVLCKLLADGAYRSWVASTDKSLQKVWKAVIRWGGLKESYCRSKQAVPDHFNLSLERLSRTPPVPSTVGGVPFSSRSSKPREICVSMAIKFASAALATSISSANYAGESVRRRRRCQHPLKYASSALGWQSSGGCRMRRPRGRDKGHTCVLML